MASPGGLLGRPQVAAAAGRAGLLVAVTALAMVTTDHSVMVSWLALLAVVAGPAVLVSDHRVLGQLSRIAEVLLSCLAATSFAANPAHGVPAAAAAAAALPYLAVPLVNAALYQRFAETAALAGTAVGVLAGSALFSRDLREAGYLTVAVSWTLGAALVAALAGTLQRRLMARQSQPHPYTDASRLLTQLRGVFRQRHGASLDPGSIAERFLDEVGAVAPVTRAAVFSSSGAGRLVVLAQSGTEGVNWETTLDSDSAIAEAWASQQPQVSARSQTKAGSRPVGEVSALVIPLIAGVRTVALAVLESDCAGAYPAPLVKQVAGRAEPAALRLEAALLFDEVRSLATSEERQRLAREIHDGVAQELVMVGYGIDNAIATLPDVDTATEDLRALRNEVTRVITELRLSLFELRSEVDRYGGLTAAISEYASTVGTSAGLRVHADIGDSAARLPATTEAELLRIAQEAITNARKHSGAENLWVTCVVDPPYAKVEISDDGKGIADPSQGGRYGLAIMKERAERIRGRLKITPRTPNGTTVTVVLGTAPRRGSV